MTKDVMNLDELSALLKESFPDDKFTIKIKENDCGCSINALFVGDELRMSWRTRAIATPVYDGRPRGESEYFDIRFWPDPEESKEESN